MVMILARHPVALRAWSPSSGVRERALVLQRSMTETLPRLWADLTDPASRAALGELPPHAEGSTDRLLFQPVHRALNLLVVDAYCQVDGEPRLDPRKIRAGGVVIRRLRRDGTQERWVVEDGIVRGWKPLSDLDEDPDPELRASRSVGHPALSARLRALRLAAPTARHAEATSPAFAAPPEVCEAVGRTLVYGILPTASSEVSEDPVPVAVSPDDTATMLSTWLKAGPPRAIPWSGRTIDVTDTLDPKNIETWDANTGKDAYLQALTQARDVLGLFDTDARGAGPRSILRQELTRLQVGRRQGNTVSYSSLLQHIDQASRALVRAETAGNGFLSVTQPHIWPAIDAATAGRIADATRSLLEARAELVPPEGRFEREGARYVARPFVRVIAEHEDCPPRLVWGPESEPFRIAPWYASRDGATPARIPLPELDRDALKKIVPNVAFMVPGSLKAFLTKNDPKKILEGNAEDGGSLGIQFICAFNIPIITLCAFILLWILITLLNIVFWWLPFIIVCLPFPKRSDG